MASHDRSRKLMTRCKTIPESSQHTSAGNRSANTESQQHRLAGNQRNLDSGWKRTSASDAVGFGVGNLVAIKRSMLLNKTGTVPSTATTSAPPVKISTNRRWEEFTNRHQTQANVPIATADSTNHANAGPGNIPLSNASKPRPNVRKVPA